MDFRYRVSVVTAAIVILMLFQGCVAKNLQNTDTIELFDELENAENLSGQISETNNDVYYITPYGKKYHYPDCSYIRRSINECREYTADEAEIQGYSACSRCIG